jgi:hypothetical protein
MLIIAMEIKRTNSQSEIGFTDMIREFKEMNEENAL